MSKVRLRLAYGKRIDRDEVLVLVSKRGVARPRVATRFCRGGNDGTRGVLILCLEILGDNSVFLDRVSGERITATRVLPRDATRREVVLQTGSVDEHIDFRWSLRTCGESLRSERPEWLHHPIRGDDYARSQCRQIKEVPADGGELLHLLWGNVRRHFGRARFYAVGNRDRDRFQLYCVSSQLEIEGIHAANQDTRPNLLRRHADLTSRHVILSRH